jgi:two-component system, sensor histidine kinase and response regulator
MFNRKLIICFIFIGLVSQVSGQRYIQQNDKKNDALKKDTAHVNLLNGLASSLRESDPQVAGEYSWQAYQIAKELNYPKGMGRALGNIGWMDYRRGDFVKALENSYDAIKISEQIRDHEEMARCLNNIGAINYEQRQYPTSLNYFRKAYLLSMQIRDLKTAARSLNNISYLYLTSGLSLDSAKIYNVKSFELSKKAKDGYLLAYNYRIGGEIFMINEDFDKALKQYNEALKLSLAIHNNAMRIAIMHRIAKIYLQTNKIADAIEVLEKNIAESKQFGYREELERSYKILGEAYEQKGDLGNAYKYLQHHLAIHDSIFNEQNSAKLGALQSRFDIDIKQAQIELLTKESALRQEEITRQRIQLYAVIGGGTFFLLLMIILLISIRKVTRSKHKLELQKEELSNKNKVIEEKSSELSRLNTTKDKLFSIIGHDFRSPLQSLKGLLELINKQNLSQQEFNYYSKDLKNKIDSMYANMNNLLNWSVMQLQGIQTKPAIINISTLTNEVMALYTEVSRQKEVSLVNSVEPETFAFADQDHVHLVIRNLVSNAIKFTPANGLVKVFSIHKGEEIEISIEDSGVGIAAKDLEKLFIKETLWTVNGTNNEKGLGLGLLLCKEFIEKNNGRLQVDSEVGKGTTFTFTLPVAYNNSMEALAASDYQESHS